ncbi:hypothetical protein N7499_007082 [Penicillium canescens]|uniref:Ima1 N-terminal domain-containing protein n=2 Tax=Penicillium canescens TaxID=5083 RepID=A0AAD6IEQ4_PENCN|nr:hypothetical protein N7522_008259 [Penicillium canescens]KAJ6044581.1 hypothetical protein N7460_005936 [Penicillium canescens]KAJ6056050.1 hypothetical protein N7444_005148 [Penicillium canescens]KAJ6082208.1 hypothetical protein N7499_007082 [Penicillium canescens]KAJ6175996.1 hypothetical protein N7485_002910 [Penicillium canescens]
MSSLFTKRLTCFYCGRRSASQWPVRNFRCEHCEADNFLDEKGEITDPPAAVTNAEGYVPGASSQPSEAADLKESPLFCSKCTRNQHLFTSSLASYFPPSDDPTDAEYERGYADFRKRLEDRYPQICESCEPRVKNRIRKAGYEAKSDHLRRMMDQSRANREARQVRNRSWRSLLLYAGALAYWASIAGQIAWDLISAMTLYQTSGSLGGSPIYTEPPMAPAFSQCTKQTLSMWRIPSDCVIDLAPAAGVALIAGALSLWWNPKLRLKIDGMPGKFKGLAEYYQAQLIVLVVRCVFWAVLKDPSASGLDPSMSPALHGLMMAFILLSLSYSRYIVQYSSRPLVNWSDNSWETQLQGAKSSSELPESPVLSSQATNRNAFNANGGVSQRFPIEKLATPQPPVEKPREIIPVAEKDSMDWTPSTTHNLRPTINQRSAPSVLNGPHPFHGQVPAAPMAPAWKLRAQPSTKPIEQVVQPNPFHRSPSLAQAPSRQPSDEAEPIFKPPKFFAPGDLDTSTGLETLFDRAFNFQPDASGPGWSQETQQNSASPVQTPSHLFYGWLRLGMLVGFISAWTFSQNHQVFIPGNYVEIAALGVASLVAGFALISMVKRPLVQWNGMEILISITELVAAVHMGAHLPTASFDRDYFDRYGKLLLMFMAIQEAMRVGSFYTATIMESRNTPSESASPHSGTPQLNQPGAIEWPSNGSPPVSSPESRVSSPPLPTHRSFESQSSAPPLSFCTTEPASSFSSALPSVSNYGLSSSQTVPSFSTAQTPKRNPHSFTMESLKQSDPPSDYDQDSDSETVATATTTATNMTNQNIRYGHNPSLGHSSMFSPRRNGLGSGMGGLSLDDNPTPRRMTRSQTQHGLLGRSQPNYIR